MQLLLAFGDQQREMTFVELHRLVDMPKASAYRVVQTLEHLGFLQRNPRNNTFTPGMMTLLTDLSRSDFEQLYPEPLIAGAVQVPSQDCETLWEMAQQDNERGYVTGASFFRPGISSIVYPNFGPRSRVAAVVSITVLMHEIPAADCRHLQQLVAVAAMKISGLLGASLTGRLTHQRRKFSGA